MTTWRPTALPHHEVPPVSDVCHNQDTPDWLKQAVLRHLESGSPTDVAMAFGLVARLGPTAASVEAVLCAPPPESAGVAWLRRLDPSVRAHFENRVIDEADLLIADLSHVEAAVSEDSDDARALAREWLHRRDDLESAVFLLERAGDASSGRTALVAVDREAAHRQAVWAMLEPIEDERLKEVWWQEPDAWWSVLSSK